MTKDEIVLDGFYRVDKTIWGVNDIVSPTLTRCFMYDNHGRMLNSSSFLVSKKWLAKESVRVKPKDKNGSSERRIL